MTSYRVLARRYRPQSFNELLGQEHVSETLKNAIKQERHAQAYLFTGPRGVGKTSAARIFAKALRCESNQDGNPCNKCESCLEVNDAKSLDVMEIDAASNTGVDSIRELRENVAYMASVGRYRVFIIDEVHMLSTAAFNALLKTLEEPPEHIVFIFATTETHKVPATIQSRCQRFDFKRLTPPVLKQSLKDICKAESVKIDKESLELLNTESEGCLRDAQSLLDQAMTLCGDSIEIAELESSLGLVSRVQFFELLRKVYSQNAGEAVEGVSLMHERGADSKQLLGRLVYFYRDLNFYIHTQKTQSEDEDYNTLLKSFGASITKKAAVYALELCLELQSKMNTYLTPSMALEALVLKLSLGAELFFAQEVPVAAAAPTSQRAPRAPIERRPMAQKSVASNAAPPPLERNAPPPAAAPVAQQEVETKSAGIQGNLQSNLEAYLRRKRPAWSPVLRSILSINFESATSTLTLVVKNDFAGRRLNSQDGEKILSEAFPESTQVKVDFSSEEGSSVSSRKEKQQEKERLAREDLPVQEAIKKLGATIVEAVALDDEKRR